ncbi:DUF6913 domain-containing protein [Yeosuana sp.]|uniref:DUF6913 domain-containing protein n=1 Tax=Yeosuana sp. TaxID=2529388 RepID=UPI00405532FB
MTKVKRQMILKGFKEKSKLKYLNKIVSNRIVDVTNNKIKSLGVIIHIDEVDDFDLFRKLAEFLNIRPNNLKVIAYSSNDEEVQKSWDSCFNSKDFAWNGKVKNVELQGFLDTKFDALISYYSKDELELKLLTAMSKAELKIGILQSDTSMNDLIIKTHLIEFDLFKSELFKYLTILKKIKNEQ